MRWYFSVFLICFKNTASHYLFNHKIVKKMRTLPSGFCAQQYGISLSRELR